MRTAQAFRVPEPAHIWRLISRAPAALWRYLSAPERLPLWALLALAALLRLLSLDLIPFGLPEVHHLERAWQAGAGAAPRTLFERALALPLRWGADPGLAAAWLVTLNLAALFVLHRVIARSHSPRTAHLAIALLAVNPWAVLLSRNLDPAALALPLSALLLAGLYTALRERRAWGWTLAWFTVPLLLDTTPWGAPLLLVAALLTLCFPSRTRWAHVLLGLLLAAFLLLPTWYHAPEQFPTRIAARFFTAEAPAGGVVGDLLTMARNIHSGQGLDALLAPSGAAYAPAQSLAGGMAALAGGLWLLSLLGVFWLAARAWSHWREGEDAAGYLIPAAWLGVSLLAYAIRGGDVAPAQLAFLLPAGALTMGLALDRLSELPRLLRAGGPWWTSWLGGAVWLFVLAYLTWGALGVATLYSHLVRYDASQGYGTPLRPWQRTADAVLRSLQDAGRKEVWIMAEGDDPTQDEEPAVLAYLLGEAARPLFVQGSNPQAILLPAERDALYLTLRSDPWRVRQLDLWGSQQIAQVLFAQAGRQADLHRVSARTAGDLLGAIPQRDWAAFDAGLRLVGYDPPALANRDHDLVLTTYWTFEDVSTRDRAAQHRLTWLLYGQDGALMARASALGLPEAAWREGLLLKQQHTLALPEGLPTGPYEAHLLIERWPDGYRHQVLDDLGYAVADRYVIGPFLFDQ
jgi:hypothetical protein